MESPKKTNHLSEPETDPRSGPPSPTWSHPVPHTRSNHLHRGNPPLRPRPPPSPPATRPYALLTRLNSARDFDESLGTLGDCGPFRDRGTRERARARRDPYRAHNPKREDRGDRRRLHGYG